jgi:ribonuclease T1
MPRLRLIVWLALLVALAGAGAHAGEHAVAVQRAEVALSELPREALDSLAMIKQGGPFPYARDGTVFFNRERILPRRPRGYYTEYTVKTPGARDRGARRIVVGGEPARSGEYWYTDDHYRSFRRIRE